jgi:hypothetical protein
VLAQGVVFEHKSLCFLSSQEIIRFHIERTPGAFWYRYSGILEMESGSVGYLFLVRLVLCYEFIGQQQAAEYEC